MSKSTKYLYVMALGFDSLYKVGISRDVDGRLESLKAANPRLRLIVAVRVKAAKSTEKAIHKYLLDKHVEREIFKLKLSDIDQIVKYARRIGKLSMKKRKKLKMDNPRNIIPIQTKPQPPCPECGASKMVLRRPRNDQDWQPFWGCRHYPDCRGTLQILPNGKPDFDDDY
jgi:hypothetical protein